MHPPEAEGVIKFTLSFATRDAALDIADFDAFNHSRSLLWQWGVLGQDDERYAGLGYGNVSVRTVESEPAGAFVITGTQTGHLPVLTAQHYAQVLAYDLSRHWLQAEGA